MITNFSNSNTYKQKIHNLIPGGAHTYSKGDDQFPLLSPAAIKNGKGAHVWDIDNNKYLDCSMGLTSVSLGHAYPSVLEAIRNELDNGVNFQRPSYLELEMAEKFLSLVPCHQMIKFSKNGSTITTAAIKLARAYTGRELVAYPEDHPFYSYDDWFIGGTECNKGVPERTKSLSLKYNSLDINSLKDLFTNYPGKIACIISEPEKTNSPENNNLDDIIRLCHDNGALFIMDEMVTGFKTAFPGSISKFKEKPDLATWGKGIANGYSFCALTGKKEIMELGGIRNEGEDKLFLISTTHGGETLQMAACMATINEFKSKNVIEHNHQIGRALINKINHIISKKGLNDYISISDKDWMSIFTFNDKNKSTSSGLRTLMLQEMIKRGILFQGAFVPCFSHQDQDLDFFANAFEQSADVYIQALEQGYENFLIGPPAKPVFRKKL